MPLPANENGHPGNTGNTDILMTPYAGLKWLKKRGKWDGETNGMPFIASEFVHLQNGDALKLSAQL